MFRRAVTVESLGVKPCWEGCGVREVCILGFIRRSAVLAKGESREMGR